MRLPVGTQHLGPATLTAELLAASQRGQFGPQPVTVAHQVVDQLRRHLLFSVFTRTSLSLCAFGLPDFRKLAHSLADLGMQTDKGLLLAATALETLRQRNIILPTQAVIERACAEAVTRANRRIYASFAPIHQA